MVNSMQYHLLISCLAFYSLVWMPPGGFRTLVDPSIEDLDYYPLYSHVCTMLLGYFSFETYCYFFVLKDFSRLGK